MAQSNMHKNKSDGFLEIAVKAVKLAGQIVVEHLGKISKRILTSNRHLTLSLLLTENQKKSS